MTNDLFEKFKNIRELSILVIIIAFSFILKFLTPYFLTYDNLKTVAIGLSADGIIAIGMTIALISGGFDLSVGSVMALSGVTTATLYAGGFNIWLAVLIGLLISALCGLVNGYFIGKIGLNPFITTLGMMGIARGIAYVITEGAYISLYDVSNIFSSLGGGDIFTIPFIVLIFIIIACFADFSLRKSSLLRKVFYTGSNEEAAILSGINTQKVKLYVFVLTAILAGIAGILTLSRFQVATPTAGTGAELRVISAAVIGGASLKGGEGSIFGAVLGVILLNIINNALILLNVSVYSQELVNGVVLIYAVTLDYLSHKSK